MLFVKENFVADKPDEAAIHTFLLRIPEELFRRLERYAKSCRRSVNNQAVLLIEQGLPSEDSPLPPPRPPRAPCGGPGHCFCPGEC